MGRELWFISSLRRSTASSYGVMGDKTARGVAFWQAKSETLVFTHSKLVVA